MNGQITLRNFNALQDHLHPQDGDRLHRLQSYYTQQAPSYPGFEEANPLSPLPNEVLMDLPQLEGRTCNATSSHTGVYHARIQLWFRERCTFHVLNHQQI